MATTVDPASATDLQGAANAFEGILAREDHEETSAAEATEAPQGANEAESPEQEETPTEEQSEEGGEGDEAVGEEAEAASSQKPPVLVTVTVDGKTEQLPIEEVIAGYQRHGDYTLKTMTLAEERKAFQANHQAVIQERAQYAQLLPALAAQLQQQEPDWQALYDANPLEYVRQKDLFRERQERAAAAQFELQRTQDLQAQERQVNLQKVTIEQRQKLLEKRPEWKDAKKWEADRQAIIEYGLSEGYSREEIDAAYDHRAVNIMDKARKWDALMASKPKPVPNRGPQVLPAGSSNTAPKNASAGSKAKNRLAQTGSVHDAAAYFLATEPS